MVGLTRLFKGIVNHRCDKTFYSFGTIFEFKSLKSFFSIILEKFIYPCMDK